MRVLAISGSLRAASTNSRLLRAAAAVAPDGVDVEIFAGLGDLPHFNPDLDGEESVAPPAVAALRASVGRADALLFSTPEYAHGVPGVLKNALDWLVSSPEIIAKPVAIVNASARSTYADASLRETLRVMSTQIVEPASITISLDGRRLDEAQMVADGEVGEALRRVLAALHGF
jgi:NAD(P)H-dependent FMN reductase